MESNIDARKGLTEREIIRNFTMLMAFIKGTVAQVGDLNSNEMAKRAEALFNQFIKVTNTGVITTLEYDPLPVIPVKTNE